MFRFLTYAAFVIVLFSSCEKYYYPSIDKMEGVLVVDAQITNDPSKNFVFLSRSHDFYSKDPVLPVSGAKVDLIESTGVVISAMESGTGYFSFTQLPEAGKNYKLRITTGKDIYESEMATMPPIPTINNFRALNQVKTLFLPDINGVPRASVVGGKEFYLDAPLSASLSNYRFYVRSVLEWVYYPPEQPVPPPPTYGWQSFYDNSRYNLAGNVKTNVTTNKIEQHPLLFLSFNAKGYLRNDTLLTCGWILIVDEFGTSRGSYDYHQKLNSQFAAEGSLFDPIQTQIVGNITCKTDPARIVFGYFDLNSYTQFRYFTNFSSEESAVTLRKLSNVPLITEQGSVQGYPPPWWQ